MPLLANWLLAISVLQIGPEGWEIFEKTRFEWEYAEEIEMEVQMPYFDEGIKKLEGKEVVITGYYLPLDLKGNRMIISKLPYAACFFCGGNAGPESVLLVEFNAVQPPFRADDLLTVSGKLELNAEDIDRMIFILKDAKVLAQ